MNEKPIKEICVYRDPRDQYFSAFRRDFVPYLARNVKDYIDFYLNGCVKKLITKDKNRLCIRFEDLILKYDETTKKIYDFCGLDPRNHVAPKSVFDPTISVVNIGAWKDFHDQNFMKQIEEKLEKYCYYPQKENLSEEAKKLLKNVL